MQQFSNKTITVKPADANQRLDIFLAAELGLSRSQAQKMIKVGEILVNGKIANAHCKVQANGKITIKVKPQNKEVIKQAALPKFKIIAETDDYVIINKPAGVIVHGGNGIVEPTLTDALDQKYPGLRKIGDNPSRPGIVHRLDKDASGLLVIAKTNAMFDHLKKQFQTRETKKIYAALVYGNIAKESDEINFPVSRSAQGYKMAAHSQAHGGRAAVTEFAVTKHFINYALLSVTIKTGRTHQIRVHLAAYGHPVVGDDLYGTRRTKELNKKLALNRIWLHAQTLGFYDLAGQWREFKSETSKELKELLKKIK
ncbi:RluA family pseudouridine synthase [Candidatus Falkowbacteria bacterium CG10_big_fil_rev_8_21_14_0_10_43_11]|uniref:Pseudouridine synthase n=1 Tax=Candidatus Falkowbacteria bacterium CG10_big_fil_rev_8_21_14_0_10_43_11 TaxID=1974568 RepID=A0A2M6WM26_9BACT|nr:MAG: RluA family pseudouridine synthase [Candidatus Falkowbacteria bacterium CG10_big_fil_rev_8_21_14_0_10_43_11]